MLSQPKALFFSIFFLLATITHAHAEPNTYELEIEITNITQHVVLTPPIAGALDAPKSVAKVFELGKPANESLAQLAEGGNTDYFAADIKFLGGVSFQDTDPILPGETRTLYLTISGDLLTKRLIIGSMLLPTNDAFIVLRGKKIINLLGKTTFLKAYDSGTEYNDELCDNIPGPQCGGEPFNEADGEGFVTVHPGIHGEGDLSVAKYNWGNPVAKVKVNLAH